MHSDKRDEGSLSAMGLLTCCVLNTSQLGTQRSNIFATGFAVCDENLRFERVNDAFAAMTGILAESHIGKSVKEVLGDAAAQIEPAMEAVLSTNESAINIQVDSIMPTRNEPGQWFASFYPVRTRAGSGKQIAVMVIETTSLRRLQDCLLTLLDDLPRLKKHLHSIGPVKDIPTTKRASWDACLNYIDKCLRSVSSMTPYLSQTKSLLGKPDDIRDTQSQVAMEATSFADDRASALTDRQIEVVKLIAAGLGNKEISAAMNVSIKTVETYRSRIMDRLGIHNISELVMFAIRNRIVEL